MHVSLERYEKEQKKLMKILNSQDEINKGLTNIMVSILDKLEEMEENFEVTFEEE